MSYTIDEFVERFVNEKLQKRVLSTAALSWGTVAAGVMVMSFTLPLIAKTYGLSTSVTSWIASATFTGMLIGAFLSGYLADIWGRKPVAIITLLLTIIFSVLTAVKMNFPLLITVRFLAGFGMGGLLPVVNTIVAEYTSIKRRGKYLVLLESSWAIGSIIIGVIAVTVGKVDWQINYCTFLIALLFLIPFAKIPETPRYLVKRKRLTYLRKAFEKLSVAIPEGIEVHIREYKKIPFSGLFKKGYTSRTLMVWYLWFTISFTYYGFFIWLPKVIGKITGISLTSSLFFLFTMMVMQLPGYLSGAYFVEKVGRKKTLFMSFLGTALFAILFAISKSEPTLYIFGSIMTAFCMSSWGAIYAYTPELYPTAFRGTANGSAGALARIGGILAPFYIALMINKNVIFALVTFSIMLFIGAFWIIAKGYETKGKAID